MSEKSRQIPFAYFNGARIWHRSDFFRSETMKTTWVGAHKKSRKSLTSRQIVRRKLCHCSVTQWDNSSFRCLLFLCLLSVCSIGNANHLLAIALFTFHSKNSSRCHQLFISLHASKPCFGNDLVSNRLTFSMSAGAERETRIAFRRSFANHNIASATSWWSGAYFVVYKYRMKLEYL
jgi:hypothetical protein